MTTTLPPSGDTPAELAEHLASGARLVEAFHLMPGVARAMREAARLLRKPCTCHPDDNPPVPCPKRYALSECKAAAPVAAPAPEPVAFIENGGLRFAVEEGGPQYSLPLHLIRGKHPLYTYPAAPAPDDTRRLRFVAEMMDGIGDIDLHEEAAINASAFGRDEPNDDDYLAAIRTAIDAAMKEKP